MLSLFIYKIEIFCYVLNSESDEMEEWRGRRRAKVNKGR
jgi:hypothetical protein